MNASQLNLVVDDFAAAVRFYSAMFARPPALLESSYAEWMLAEPHVRFTIFAAGAPQCETAPGRGWRPPHELRAQQRRRWRRAAES